MANNESRLIFHRRSKRVVMQIDPAWHTCARVPGFRSVSKEIIYGASDAGVGGREAFIASTRIIPRERNENF